MTRDRSKGRINVGVGTRRAARARSSKRDRLNPVYPPKAGDDSVAKFVEPRSFAHAVSLLPYLKRSTTPREPSKQDLETRGKRSSAREIAVFAPFHQLFRPRRVGSKHSRRSGVRAAARKHFPPSTMAKDDHTQWRLDSPHQSLAPPLRGATFVYFFLGNPDQPSIIL